MWTGCRSEELCSLECKDVAADHCNILEGKTDAAARAVPFPRELSQTIERLFQDS